MNTLDHAITLAAGVVSLRANAASDVGNIRKPNEDSFLADTPIFLVPDGMGGHSHGDWASHTVVETFASHIPSALVTTPAAILSTISRANSAVQELIDDGEITEVEASLLQRETSSPGQLAYLMLSSRMFGCFRRGASKCS